VSLALQNFAHIHCAVIFSGEMTVQRSGIAPAAMMLMPAVSCFKSFYMETHAHGREDSVIIIKEKSKFQIYTETHG